VRALSGPRGNPLELGPEQFGRPERAGVQLLLRCGARTARCIGIGATNAPAGATAMDAVGAPSALSTASPAGTR